MPPLFDRLQHPIDGNLLVKAQRPGAALIRVGYGGEAVAPGDGLRERHQP